MSYSGFPASPPPLLPPTSPSPPPPPSEEEEDEEMQETSEVSGASKRSAASADEEEINIATSNRNLASCSQHEIRGGKRRIVISEAQENKEHELSTILDALTAINAVCSAWIAHSPHKTCLPDLEKVRNATRLLLNNTDAAISSVKAQQILLDRKALKQKLYALRQELARSVEQSQAEHRKQAALLQEAKADLLKQSKLFQKEKESLTHSHKLEREALMEQHTHVQRDLKRQLEEERDKSICCVCHDKPRDTIILPCLHFQYCFSCLLRHRDRNSNTCPTCRGPIQGLNMSSYLATQ